mgnify:FL=1
MDENIKKQLDDVCNIIDEKLEKSAKSIKDNVNNEVDTVIKGEVKNLVEKHSEIVDRLDKIEVENKKDNFEKVYTNSRDMIADSLNKSESFKAMKEGSTSNANFELKADVLISSDFTGANSARDASGVERISGVKFNPSNITNMLNVIPTASTTSNVIRYVKENSYTDNASATAEGSAPSDTEFALVASDAIVQKIASVVTISQEMLDDTPALAGYLNTRLVGKLNTVVDDQLIGGSGSSPNLLGLLNGGTAFDTSASGAFYQAIDNAQELDVLYVALNQLALANYSANAIILNPTDFHKIALLKDTTNEYLRGNSIVSADGFLRINGVPVIMNNKMSAGNFCVGDFSQGSQVFQREGVNVAFGYEDSDNFSKYLVSVRAITRLAHAVYLPDAFVRGAFSSAKTAIETS